MTEPLNPPAYPSEITTFQHGDSRVFMTAEQLEKQTTQYSQQLKEFEQVDPQDQDEAQELFDRMVTEVLPGRREIDTQAQVNQWTGQIVYASLNLGMSNAGLSFQVFLMNDGVPREIEPC